MKTIILALLLLTNIAMAQMPCTNDCVGTNANPTMPPPIPLEALQLRIRPTEFGLSNTIPNNIYQAEASTNLMDWIVYGLEFTNATGAEHVLTWTNRADKENFRAHEIGFYEHEEVTVYNSTLTCFGTVAGRCQFYLDFDWGYPVNSNFTIISFEDGTGRTDTYIDATGRYGDYHCGSGGKLFITNPPSPEYRASFYWASNVPSTNVDYPGILKGLLK